MTRYLADYTSYQGSLTAADFHRAEFQVINFKTSHALGTARVHPQIVREIASAKKLGMGIGSYHWLTGDAPGADQARYAYARLQSLGITAGTMHTVDVEEQTGTDDAERAPSWAHVRDYVNMMRVLLGRWVQIYTGDWWWTAPGRGWNGSSVTPYLMAAPNAGYLDRYPGATSSHWVAGYGGWPNLSTMQYVGDAPLLYPDGTRSTVMVSKSAIRDESVWRALSGGK
jgi:GH25 family lysozyme M1 (1,4-beta-N-acetylmuramidase)